MKPYDAIWKVQSSKPMNTDFQPLFGTKTKNVRKTIKLKQTRKFQSALLSKHKKTNIVTQYLNNYSLSTNLSLAN